MPGRPTIMLAIAGGKGGCGKTTTALGLARAFARRGGSPLVVDADAAMPDLHERAAVDPRPGLSAVTDGRDPEAVARTVPGTPGARILPAGDRTDLGDALVRLEAVSDPVLVDCPAGAGPPAAVPLRIADRALVVSGPTTASRRAAAKTATMARTLGAPPVGVVHVRTDGDPEPGFDAGTLGSVPAVATGEPLSDPRVRDAYARIEGRLSWNVAGGASRRNV